MFSTATRLHAGHFQIWLVDVDQGVTPFNEFTTDYTSIKLVKQKAEALPSWKHIQELGLAVCKVNAHKDPLSIRIDYWTSDYSRSEARLALSKDAEFIIPC